MWVIENIYLLLDSANVICNLFTDGGFEVFQQLAKCGMETGSEEMLVQQQPKPQG